MKPTWSPAVAFSASAVLSTSTSAQFTSTTAVSLSSPSFDVVTAAVLDASPQSPASLVAITCTEVEAPAASVLGAKTRFSPSIDQPADAGEIDQANPAGSTSVNSTPRAWPSPVLASVTVKPIWSPAVTLSSSATFATSMAAQFTSTDASSESDPSFVVVTVAVLSTCPQSVAPVAATTCTVVLAPPASVVGL